MALLQPDPIKKAGPVVIRTDLLYLELAIAS